jgi:D-alanine-D-alanine ligase
MPKLNVAIVFGGRSAEHEISIRSAQNVIEAIDKERYELVFIAIDKEGKWLTNTNYTGKIPSFPLSMDQFTEAVAFNFMGDRKIVVPAKDKAIAVDLFFPILHGPYGEDGTIQGLFRSLNIPFVGCDVLASAVGMDKDVMKRLLKEANIPIGKYRTVYADDIPDFEEIESYLGLPVYIKPANMGSSVGISKVRDSIGYEKALAEAFKYDRKVVIEENIDGLELECAVLGNRHPEASAVGQITSFHDFYTYESKYLDDKGSKLEIPAQISKKDTEAIRQLSVRVFETLEAEGLGRVDVFLKRDGTVIVNEINTMPGFTSISMYPMLWKEMGVSYSTLIDRLIELAMERHQQRLKLSTTYLA